ncbi:MAG: serine/threonine-protein phosphatase [Armatimonadetes bacterium]|nr:serine/threonine-protein phosphatase [Anaerolineae bacterium]
MNDLESDAEDKTLPGSVLSTNSPRAPLKPAGATAELPPLPDSTEPLRPPMPSKLGQTTPLPMIPDGTTRPLTPEKAIASNNSPLSFGQSSDVGLVRTNNQDAAYSFFVTNRSVEERPDFGLFIVADGMGGHHDGEKASALTARVVAAQVNNHVYMPMLNPTQDPDRPTIIEALTQAVQRANAEVMLKVPEGGTTITAVAVLGDLAHIAHVGDSRAYLVTQDSIEQITRDHSLVQRLIELDQLTQEEANDHPQKNVLYRAIGQSETLEVDTLTRRLPHNSRVLICSDGLWSQMNSDEISAIVMELPPQEACDKLVALANTRGGTDNITAIVLKIPR